MVSADELKYWVAFSGIAGIGRVRISQLQEYFGSLQDAWQAPEGKLRQAGLDSRSIDALVTLRPRISLDTEMEKLERYRIKVLIHEDPLYPARLKEIYDYPPVLYVRGNLPVQDEPCLAIVGTRRPTIYGRQVTEEIVTDLARSKITIVSGLARGIDSIAHRAALDAGGKTIAVFASGLDIVYPGENAKLAQAIIEHGAVLSEHPLSAKPKPENFPLRNRIMSGLSLGVLVVEAGERSGALITAHQAVEQNREVFAIPGSTLSPASQGTNRLIQEGAKLVRNYTDILQELNLTIVAQQADIKEFSPVDEAESAILKQLSSEPNHIDEICRRSGLTMPEVSSTLAMLELKGIARQVGASKLVIVESPAKARTLNKILGRSYSVKASLGHVRDLPRASLGVDIEKGFIPQYVIPTKKKKIVGEIKKAAAKASSIYLATDPDREGEAISWHLIQATKLDKNEIPVHRVVFQEITKDAIQEAFQSPRSIDMNLVNAQQARRILDRLVGYKLSPLLWKKVQRGLSAGRVQSVAVRMIIDREREIQDFIPREYWIIEVELAPPEEKEASFRARLFALASGTGLDITNKDEADRVVADLEQAAYAVKTVVSKQVARQPAPPFTTSTLQQEAWRKLHFSARQTMAIAQQLYEGLPLGEEGAVGLITYMRTDSTHVAASAISEARQFIREKYGDKFLPPKPRSFAKKAKWAQEAHEAIRPTKTSHFLIHLS